MGSVACTEGLLCLAGHDQLTAGARALRSEQKL